MKRLASSTWLLTWVLLLSSATSLAAVDEPQDTHVEGADGMESAPGAVGGHDHHVPHFSDINWVYGLIGEKPGVEPSLLWRPPGTPVPLAALLVNTAILFFLIGKFGGPAIAGGLVNRKKRIAGEILAASKMKAEAEQQLAHYEGKLRELGEEMNRIKEDMRSQAESDRARALDEAKAHRAALEAEARQLITQELAHARHEAILKAVSQSVEVARQHIQAQLTVEDHERLAGNLIPGLRTHLVKKETRA